MRRWLLVCACLCSARVTLAAPQEELEEPAEESDLGSAEDAGELTQEELDALLLEDEQVIIISGISRIPQIGEIVIDAKEAIETPGVQGDAVKAVTVAPSVARPTSNAPGVSVRGATPAESRLYIDDIPIPRLFHFGGVRSVLSSAQVAQIEVIAGGASARYGRALGGAVSVTTARPEQDEISHHLHLDALDFGTQFSSSLGENSHLRLSARTSLLSSFFEGVTSERERSVFAIPEYSDFSLSSQTKLEGGRSSAPTLSLLFLASRDSLARQIPSIRPQDKFREEQDGRFERLGATLVKRSAEGSKRITLWVGRDLDTRELDFVETRAQDRRKSFSGGLLLSQVHNYGPRFRLRLGLDAEIQRAAWRRFGSLSIPSREGDIYVFGQPPGDRVSLDEWQVTQLGLGAFSSAYFRIGERVQLQTGLRAEPNLSSGTRILPVRPTEPEVGYSDIAFAIGPRVRLNVQPADHWELTAAAGRYHQAPVTTDLSPVFGNPRLVQARADQIVAALGYRRGDSHVELAGFATRQDKLAARSLSATPTQAQVVQSTGQGRVFGGELSGNGKLGDSWLWATSYTLMKAERRQASSAPWRLFDRDQRHIFRAALSWKPNENWRLGARTELSSGFPRTPVLDATFNVGSQRFEPIFGAHNGDRLPTFFEAAARISYQYTGRFGTLRAWLDLVNATNRNNVEEVFYSSDYSGRDYVRARPILPVVGIEVEK